MHAIRPGTLTVIPQVSRPALVLDIDDTALTNWEVIKASNRGACY